MRRAEKEAPRGARAEEKKARRAAKKKADKRDARNRKRRGRRAATKEAGASGLLCQTRHACRVLSDLHFETNYKIHIFPGLRAEHCAQGLRGAAAKVRRAAANERAKERKKTEASGKACSQHPTRFHLKVRVCA